jgi:hypothetical protein
MIVETEMYDLLREATAKIIAEHNAALEGILSDLIKHGTTASEIELRRYVSDGRTEILVRGVPRAELFVTSSPAKPSARS